MAREKARWQGEVEKPPMQSASAGTRGWGRQGRVPVWFTFPVIVQK